VKGRIPDLSDIGDLMWIENALRRKDLDPAKRAALEGLQKKDLAGTLRQSELRAFKEAEKPAQDRLAGILTALRGLRKEASGVAGLPPEALAHLDAAINLVNNEKVLKVADLRMAPPRSAA